MSTHKYDALVLAANPLAFWMDAGVAADWDVKIETCH